MSEEDMMDEGMMDEGEEGMMDEDEGMSGESSKKGKQEQKEIVMAQKRLEALQKQNIKDAQKLKVKREKLSKINQVQAQMVELDQLSNEIYHDKSKGMYLVGMNITEILNYLATVGEIQARPVNTMKELDATEKDLEEAQKILGEFINVSLKDTLKEQGYYRNPKYNYRELKPEQNLSKNSSLDDILRSATKFTDSQSLSTLTSSSMLKMIKTLSRYRKTDSQWFHVASLLEIMFRYIGFPIGMTRMDFFDSQLPIDYFKLRGIEEFWKTEETFMTRKEKKQFGKDLIFYVH